jgi:hypothetical protein
LHQPSLLDTRVPNRWFKYGIFMMSDVAPTCIVGPSGKVLHFDKSNTTLASWVVIPTSSWWSTKECESLGIRIGQMIHKQFSIILIVQIDLKFVVSVTLNQFWGMNFSCANRHSSWLGESNASLGQSPWLSFASIYFNHLNCLSLCKWID